MTLEPGTKVSTGEYGDGIVVRTTPTGVIVNTEEWGEMELPLGECTPKPDFKQQMMLKHSFSPDAEKIPKSKSNKPLDLPEFDLHFEAMQKKGLCTKSDNELSVQLSYFQNIINRYKGKKGAMLIIIHGQGDGTLRQKIRSLLRTNYPAFVVEDASFQKYGYQGATKITVR